MVQCEMCGTETSPLKTVQIEGAELQVCQDCAAFGTEVRQEDSSSSSTKYSTDGKNAAGDSGRSGNSAGSEPSAGGSSGSSSRPDPFDDMDTLAQDYDERIRSAREAAGLSQADLAKQLNEKASLIRKLERGSMLPSDQVQRKLEREFDIDLSEEGPEEAEWESEGTTGGYTLGDVVEHRDS